MSTVHVDNHGNGSSGVIDHPPNNSTEITPKNNGDDFSSYFDQWIVQQQYDLQALLAATSVFSPSTSEQQENHQIQSLIDRVISNYENYYIHKSNSAKNDVKLMFSPTWTSTTENMFLWVGGWRPSMAFHLLYSMSGVQLESQLSQVMNGTSSAHDLSNISHSQMQQINKLQMKTIKLEQEISEKMAKIQETGANQQMVELVNIITENGGSGGDNEGEKMLKPQMETKEHKMKRVLEKADQLRMNTLRGVINILKPLQALHFLIAAAELHLRVHEYGKSIDAQRALAT